MSPDKGIPIELVAEGQRVMSICNACRYCEGYCAVFPALERRLEFNEGDLTYLANLCHQCNACYYACQYAPPHEFQLDFPAMLAAIRRESYRKYAWPRSLGAAFRHNAWAAGLASAAGLALLLILMLPAGGAAGFFAPHRDVEGSFYALLPHRVMAVTFGVAALAVVVALFAGFRKFWRDGNKDGDLRFFGNGNAFGRAVWDAMCLKYLDGGGDGCTYPTSRPSLARRRFHHLTFYGFMLCFAATCVATLYHYGFGWRAPYPFWSAPVLLGTIGGVGLIVGPLGLLWLRAKSDPALADDAQTGMDVAFIAMLLASGASGLLLLALRESAAMGVLLAAHLAVVMGLFLTMPYGKFVHGIYRFAALVRYEAERRLPPPPFTSE
jgi:citrate/tricarballylate utilization protein